MLPTQRLRALRIPVYATIGWTALYVGSKIHLAYEGRLGVTGGPSVPPESYAAFGPGEVAQAQLGNATAGLLLVGLVLATLLRAGRHWLRRGLVGLLALCSLIAVAGGVGFIARALVTDRGGALFGVYCLVWAALLIITTVTYRRAGQSIQAGPSSLLTASEVSW